MGALAAVLPAGSTPWLTKGDALLTGLCVGARVWANGLFALVLGPGRIAAWPVEEAWRQPLLLVLLLAALRARDFHTGLLALATHVLVCL